MGEVAQTGARRRRRAVWLLLLAGAAAVLLAAAWVWRDDILRTALDPKTPYQVYRQPPAPDYARADSWALLPGPAQPSDGPADVFFVGPTTYDGGRHWNAPVPHARSAELTAELALPNFAGPFRRAGRVFAPHYRQASLYTRLTLRDDAREARAFAYRDVDAAFTAFLQRSGDRPILLVGVEQGAELADRLLRDRLAGEPAALRRLAAAYLIDALVPADAHAPGAATPLCAAPEQAGCVVAYKAHMPGERRSAAEMKARALTWLGDELVNLSPRPAACVNPVLGLATEAPAPARLSRGAANASGLEWGARPAFLPRQVGAVCQGGLLEVTRPDADGLQPPRGWAERLRTPPFNLFWADLEADSLRRLAAYGAAPALRRGS